MTVSTNELIKNIQIAVDINAFSQANQEEFLCEPPHDYLNRMLREKGFELPQICALCELDPSYCYRIFSGARIPGRNALLHITLTLALSVEETQLALRLYQLARLDPRCYRDAALIFAISKQYTVIRTTELLHELGEDGL